MRYDVAGISSLKISNSQDSAREMAWPGIDISQLERLSVLVIEENDLDFQDTEKNLLAMETYEVTIDRAQSLPEVKRAALQSKYDVVLIDFCLGSDTGVLAMQAFGGRESEVALILISGISSKEIQQIALKAGAIACLSKAQINPVLLDSTITCALHNHQFQRDLLNSIHHLEEETSSKNSLCANMGHDLKTPLNAIMGYAEIISENCLDLPLPTKYRDYARKIRSGGLHLLEVINNLVLHSSDMNTEESKQFEIVELNKLTKRATDLVSILAQNKNIHLDVSLTSRELYVRGQPSQITQAVVNVISNAIKYTENSGSISVEVSVSNDRIRVAVTDTGIGMTDSEIVTAMTPFGRCKLPPHLSQEGTGLGLSIVEKIVISHNGDLSISSEPGKGTVVGLLFPSMY